LFIGGGVVPVLYVYLMSAAGLIAFLLWFTLTRTRIGKIIRAAAQNPSMTSALGLNTRLIYALVFSFGGLLAGLAGSTKMLIFVSATLSDATWQMSGLVILMTLIGGMGTLVGPVIGAFIVVLLENKVGDFGAAIAKYTGIEWFQRLGESVTIVIGLIFVICVLAFRRGLVGELNAWLEKRKSMSTQA
jgi:branched-chain amino acid transport system permease protein